MAFGQNTASLAATGATLGSFAPGAGTLIGAGVGALIGLGLDLWGSSTQAETDLLQANSDVLSYETQSLALDTQINAANNDITQAKSDISAYEQFLAAFPNAANLQKNSFEAQSRNEYKGLLSNYAMGNAYAGASGRVGGSAGLVTAEDQAELVDYSGADMALGGGDGGRYQMSRDELYNNLTMQEEQARTQLGVYQTSLSTLQDNVSILTETQDLYDTAATSAATRVTQETKAVETWWNPFD